MNNLLCSVQNRRLTRHFCRERAINAGIIRPQCRRYAWLTQTFSKKLENHICAFGLHTMYHNFVKISGAHGMTSAMAAGVTDKLWEMAELVAKIEAWESGSG
jgi:hypothetical protein